MRESKSGFKSFLTGFGLQTLARLLDKLSKFNLRIQIRGFRFETVWFEMPRICTSLICICHPCKTRKQKAKIRKIDGQGRASDAKNAYNKTKESSDQVKGQTGNTTRCSKHVKLTLLQECWGYFAACIWSPLMDQQCYWFYWSQSVCLHIKTGPALPLLDWKTWFDYWHGGLTFS